MIKHLYIKNFVLIDELDLDFHHGFSVFTGETGAGKSILIDAISLLKAERAAVSYIQKGAERALIEGTFDLSKDEHAVKVLQDAGFDVNDEVTFTREIHSNGKSTARIDHRIVTVSLMHDVLQNEIDIHGQRDTAYLLNTGTHLHLLDEYLNNQTELNDTKEAFQKYDALVKSKETAETETYNENDLEYFRYEISEIEDAELKIGEDDELAGKEKTYRSIKESYEKLNAVFSLYDDSLSDSFYDLNRQIQALKADERVEAIQTTVNDSYYSLSDAMEQLRSLLDSFSMSEEDINAMEERLFTIQKLKHKYGHTIEDILAKKEELEKQVEVITHRQEYLDEINAEIDKAKKNYEIKAERLSQCRQQRSHELDEAIAKNLQELMLENARFHTEIKKGNASLYGSDKVEFLISMNKGEDLKSLSKTASGGELSRLMLGLKVIFSKLQGIQTVIFDEIDTGVSGPVATAIGRKMRSLSQGCQVFSVTHLAQVAACGEYHYLVSKTSDQENTKTSVALLNDKQRIEQLALIANGDITPASLKASQELLKRNQKA